MDAECRVVVSDAVAAEAGSEAPKQSARRSSTLSLLMLLLTLGLAAAAAVVLLSTHTKEPAREEGSFDLHHTLRQLSNVRAAIHLEGKYNPDFRSSAEWMNQVDQSHSQGGLVLDNNEIVVPNSGLYFVYTQASFRVSCSSTADDDSTARPMVHLGHTVERWSRSYGDSEEERPYQTILHSVRTACQKTASTDGDDAGSWYSAVYMGAVFRLSQGDRLKTVTMETLLPDLEDDSGKTFFGVFAL